MKMPYSVSRKKNVKASNGRVEPIQANLFGRKSMRLEMIRESVAHARIEPSAATIRSASRNVASDAIDFVLEFQLHAKRRARSCKSFSSVVRAQPQKPLPPMRCTLPLKWISMSSQ